MFDSKLRNIVSQYLSVAAFQSKWRRDQQIGAGNYYSITYPYILSFFKEHTGLSNALEMKVAFIFSWNPTICKVTSTRFEQARNDLTLLEESLEGLNKKDVLSVDVVDVLDKLWEPIKRATSPKDSPSCVSVTKFLHFSFPNIFPMVDKKTIHKLGGSSVNKKKYTQFMLAWKELYKREKMSFDQISSVADVPIARVLDIMIFNPS